MQYTITGKIKVINETETFGSGFTKREFVVTDNDEKYPQDIKLEFVKDKCTILDNYKIGQEVEVYFNIRGNEHNGKYYVNLGAWKISAIGGNQAQPAPAQTVAPSQPVVAMDDLKDDDIPF